MQFDGGRMGRVSAHRMLGAGGWGMWRMGWGWGAGREQTIRGSGNKDQILGIGGGVGWGGQKGKPEEQLGIQVSEMRGLGEPGESNRAE